MARMGASIALIGNAAPTVVKLSTAHNEQILIDMRSEGSKPNMKMPKAWEASTVSAVSANTTQWAPALVKCNTPMT